MEGSHFVVERENFSYENIHFEFINSTIQNRELKGIDCID